MKIDETPEGCYSSKNVFRWTATTILRQMFSHAPNRFFELQRVALFLFLSRLLNLRPKISFNNDRAIGMVAKVRCNDLVIVHDWGSTVVQGWRHPGFSGRLQFCKISSKISGLPNFARVRRKAFQPTPTWVKIRVKNDISSRKCVIISDKCLRMI